MKIPEWLEAMIYIGFAIWSVQKLLAMMQGGLSTNNPFVAEAGIALLGYLGGLVNKALV